MSASVETMETSVNQLQKTTIDEFKARFRGDVILPGDPSYNEVRHIWNAMIDRGPAMIARCTSPEDVVQAVKFARKQNLLVSVRGGGHNIAGNAVCDDGLMIDLSLMKSVRVDPNALRAIVEPGCVLADFDAVAQAHGLATPLGINSTTSGQITHPRSFSSSSLAVRKPLCLGNECLLTSPAV
jgi:hypothetical protein